MRRNSAPNVRRCAIIVSAFGLAATASAQVPVAASGAAPCLQKLQEQKARELAKPKKKKTGGVFGIIVGAAGGFALGQLACKGKTGGDRVRCLGGTTVAGGVLGNVLGRKLDAASQKKVVEASYASAFSGQPSTLTLDEGCAMVETIKPMEFEPRDVEIALEDGVAAPPGVLRAVGEPQRASLLAPVEASNKKSRKPLRKLPANSNAFVMGTVDNGKWLLIGRGSDDAGYVASGYAPAAGWSRQPNLKVASTPAEAAQNVAVKAELPCWTSKVTVRSEGEKGQQDTVDTRLCRGPDGVTEAPQAPA